MTRTKIAKIWDQQAIHVIRQVGSLCANAELPSLPAVELHQFVLMMYAKVELVKNMITYIHFYSIMSKFTTRSLLFLPDTRM